VKLVPFIEFGGSLTRNEGFGKGFWAHRGTPILQSGLAAVEVSGLKAKIHQQKTFMDNCNLFGESLVIIF
jgi:hypothetical protein